MSACCRITTSMYTRQEFKTSHRFLNLFRVYRSIILCADEHMKLNNKKTYETKCYIFCKSCIVNLWVRFFCIAQMWDTKQQYHSVYRTEKWTKTPLCYTICNHCLPNHKHVHCIRFYFHSSRWRTIYFESCQMGMFLRLNRCDEICILIKLLKSLVKIQQS